MICLIDSRSGVRFDCVRLRRTGCNVRKVMISLRERYLTLARPFHHNHIPSNLAEQLPRKIEELSLTLLLVAHVGEHVRMVAQ